MLTHNIEHLKKRLDYLEEVLRFTLDALDMAASLGNFQSSINMLHDPSQIVIEVKNRVSSLIRFEATAFYLVNEEDSDFYVFKCDPEDKKDEISGEIEIFIEDGTFSRAILENRPVLAYSKDFKKPFLIHVMTTISRVRGMFVGILKDNPRELSQASLSLLSIILLNGANALESFELYGRIRQNSENLEEINKQLKIEITDRRQAEMETQKTNSLLWSLINSTPDLIFYKDKALEFLGCNEAFSIYSGVSSNDIKGLKDEDIFKENEGPSSNGDNWSAYKAHEEERKLIEKNRTIRNEEWVVYPGGKKVLLDTIKSPYYGPKNEVLGLIGVSRDITLRHKMEQELHEAKLKADAANKAKSDFLSNMSHELRTPLNSVIGFSQILSEEVFGELNTKQRKYVDNVLAGGKQLLQLINDILDLSTMESGKMALDLTMFNIPKMVEKSLFLITEKSLIHRLKLTLDVHLKDKKQFIVADERKLMQVMFNLLTNAVKFTPDGGEITVSIYEEDKSVRVDVKDTGIGIDSKNYDEIFEEFVQLDASLTRKSQGTGLGLALVKKLIHLHGGKIWVKSEGVDKGSTFSFTIPSDLKLDIIKNVGK